MEKDQVTLQDAREHGLTEEEFNQIQKILGRIPNSTELGIFSGMWSEHCSYKNSILKLKTFPTQSKLMLAKAGEENAGVLDIGDNLALVFKIESHNHPTAVEPYQGAATGVGGIMRDIFTMGARPFASLNSLRFGTPDNKRNKYLLTRAVKGIGDYGNSLGIAVSGGELYFDNSFTRNPLVNAMTIGCVEHNRIAKATTGGAVGHSVFYVGATTGRDGIHGASFASRDLTKESEEQKSAVQVGDPFMEKLLMEASLEVIEKDLLIGIQDMGAAGLSCSSSEMAAKGNTGIEINLDLVPFRETNMNAYEAMLSESQERMLLVPKKGMEEDVQKIFHKWGLNAVKIGVVTDDGFLRVKKDGKIKAEIPAESLVLGGGAPRYVREEKRPKYLDEIVQLDLNLVQDITVASIESTLKKLVGSLNICSRHPLFEQYDTDVGLVELIGPGFDGGLSRIPGTNKGIASSTDCNSRYTYTNPYKGSIFAVCESARNVVVTGARPIGITDNLNFANPYIPENYYMFAECIRGAGDACRFLELPVTGGNVSFYNESPDGPVYPTPTIGMVGYLSDIQKQIKNYIGNVDMDIALIGRFRPSLGATEYLKNVHDMVKGDIPELDLSDEKNLIELVLKLNQNDLIHSAKDLSLGGLLVALSKICFYNKIGIEITGLKKMSISRLDTLLFGETASSILVSYKPEQSDKIQTLTKEMNLDFYLIGQTTKEFELNLTEYQTKIKLGQIEKDYLSGLVSIFENE